MSRRSLELYAARARTIADPSLASGRLIATKIAERRILRDVVAKLDVGPQDTVLDIGAGIGMLTIPLSFMVQSVAAIDHPEVLARLQARAPAEQIECIPGNFLDLELGDRRFSRILVYDVLHYLANMDEVLAFVDKAIALLEPNGKLLLGDLPNSELMDRIMNTDEGQRYVAHWTKAKWATSKLQQSIEGEIGEDAELVTLGDPMLFRIAAHARSHGHHAYLLRQDPGLPLWHQREDLLIERLVPGPKRQQFLVKLSDGAAAVLGTREAQLQDCELYYAWSQDVAVRASSLRPEAFTLEQHRAWFASKLADRENVRMYVLERDAEIPLGQVRYEVVREGRPLYSGGPAAAATDGSAEISLSIDPRARGIGLGVVGLAMSYDSAKAALGVERVVALVKPENSGSIKSFMRAGYRQTGETERLGQKVMVLER